MKILIELGEMIIESIVITAVIMIFLNLIFPPDKRYTDESK